MTHVVYHSPVVDIWIASRCWLLCTRLLWTLIYKSLCGYILLLGKLLLVQFLGSNVRSCYRCKKLSNRTLEGLQDFIFPLEMRVLSLYILTKKCYCLHVLFSHAHWYAMVFPVIVCFVVEFYFLLLDFFFFWDKISLHSSVWLWICYEAQASLLLTILLARPLKFWDDKYVPPCQASVWFLIFIFLIINGIKHLLFSWDHSACIYLSITYKII